MKHGDKFIHRKTQIEYVLVEIPLSGFSQWLLISHIEHPTLGTVVRSWCGIDNNFTPQSAFGGKLADFEPSK